MKKIIFACDGKNFSPAAIRFAEACSSAEQVLISGVFFNTTDYAMLAATTVGIETPAVLSLTIEDERREIEHSIELFENACRHAGLEYRVHNNSSDWNMGNLVTESRFADLLLLGMDVFFREADGKQAGNVMKDILHKAECPVMLVPENWQPPEKLLFAYDGRKESVYAMKEFAHLFPHWRQLPANIIYIHEDDGKEIPELPLLEELAARHFSNLEITRLDFNGKKYFELWASEIPANLILVTGAFGRSMFSMSLKKSFLAGVIEQHRVPIFAGHH